LINLTEVLLVSNVKPVSAWKKILGKKKYPGKLFLEQLPVILFRKAPHHTCDLLGLLGVVFKCKLFVIYQIDYSSNYTETSCK
jgi:hypothetical protein